MFRRIKVFPFSLSLSLKLLNVCRKIRHKMQDRSARLGKRYFHETFCLRGKFTTNIRRRKTQASSLLNKFLSEFIAFDLVEKQFSASKACILLNDRFSNLEFFEQKEVRKERSTYAMECLMFPILR